MNGGVLLIKFTFYKAFLLPVVFFILITSIASVHALSTFSLINDSFSMLGGQNFEAQWIMNVGWMGFGLLIIIIVSMYHNKDELKAFMTYPLLAFGFSVFFLGIFSSDSMLIHDLVDTEEAQDHFVFYGIALGSLGLSMIVHAMMSKDKRLKMYHSLFFLVIVSLMMLYIWASYGRGLIEKCGWIIALIWLASMFGRIKEHGNIY